jgi:sarcosine oxidase subunit beta
MDLPHSADVVIIGGGVIGVSIAWHLADAGLQNIVLLERATLASGSTSKAAGGIRLQFADRTNLELMLRAVPAYERFQEQFGVDIGLHQPGYLFLLEACHEPLFSRARELQASLGIATERWTVEQVAERIPQLNTAGLSSATYNPRDGYATPESVVQGYAAAAHALGVRIVQSCEVKAIPTSAGRITAVTTAKGTVATDTVVCAAGVGSAPIAAMVGLEIPVRGEPHWIHYSPTDCGLPADLPLTIDWATSFYVHREGAGLLLSAPGRHVEDMARIALSRFPILETMTLQSSWWGDYELSPDHNAVVGRAEQPASFYYATGFSGHGFQQAPAIGEHIAQLISGHQPSVDLSSLSLARFARGHRREEAFVI